MSEGLIAFILFVAAALPMALFDLAFLSGFAGALLFGALLVGVVLCHRTFVSDVRLQGGTVALCVALSLALCLLGGEMHVFSPTSDWIVRDSVLHDLVVAPWPVHYVINSRDFLLRAPLGLYLVPAAAGKLFGLTAAHIALLLQNAAILACLLILFTAHSRTWRERLSVLGLFVFFSGLDALPWAKSWVFGENPPPFGWHLEAWVAWLQYSSHVTQLFWVPHHALAGWGFIAAYLSWRRGNLSAWSLVAVFFLCIFWSPLAMMGALPFLCTALLSGLYAGQLQRRDAIGPLLIAASTLPALMYLSTGSDAVERRWLFTEAGYPLRYIEFLLVELALWFWIFYITPRQEDETFKPADLWIAAISLLLFPLYSISFSNDFTMRASIPALAVIALAASPRVLKMMQTPGLRRAVLIAGLIIAAVTPGVEIARAIVMPTVPFGTCPLTQAWNLWGKEIGDRHTSMASYLTDAASGLAARFLVMPAQKIAQDAPCTN